MPDIHSKMPNHDLVNRDLAFSYFRNRRDKPQSVIKQHSISVQMIFLFYRWLRQMETPDPLWTVHQVSHALRWTEKDAKANYKYGADKCSQRVGSRWFDTTNPVQWDALASWIFPYWERSWPAAGLLRHFPMGNEIYTMILTILTSIKIRLAGKHWHWANFPAFFLCIFYRCEDFRKQIDSWELITPTACK